MAFWDDIGKTIGKFAPALGASLGGPLGGIAGKALADALGVEEGDQGAIQAAVAGLSGEQITALRTAEIEYQKFLKQNEIDLEKIAADDRKSARDMQAETKDTTPRNLAYAIVFIWAVWNFILITHNIPTENREIIVRVGGTLDGAVLLILGFYYGTNRQSIIKDQTINRLSA